MWTNTRIQKNICEKTINSTMRQNNQSFMIGIEPHLKQQVYEPNFWPTNVLFDRFNFKLRQHFLDRLLYKHTSKDNKSIAWPIYFYKKENDQNQLALSLVKHFNSILKNPSPKMFHLNKILNNDNMNKSLVGWVS